MKSYKKKKNKPELFICLDSEGHLDIFNYGVWSSAEKLADKFESDLYSEGVFGSFVIYKLVPFMKIEKAETSRTKL